VVSVQEHQEHRFVCRELVDGVRTPENRMGRCGGDGGGDNGVYYFDLFIARIG